MKSMAVFADEPLEKPLSLTAYSTYKAATERGAPFAATTLAPTHRLRLYLGAPSKAAGEPGDVLLGSVRYVDAPNQQPGGARPGGFPIRYVVPAQADLSDDRPTVARPEDTSADERMQDAVFAARVSELEKLKQPDGDELFEQTVIELLAQRPGDRSVLLARLHRLDVEAHRKQRLAAVVAAADAVLAVIDRDQLASQLALRVDPHDDPARHARSEAEATRDVLTDTLYRKGRALGYMELPEVLAEHAIADEKAHDEAFRQNIALLGDWVDTTDEKFSLLEIRHRRRSGDYGLALALLAKRMKDAPPNRFHLKKRRDLYELLGWHHAHAHAATWYVVSFPDEFEGF